MTQTKVCSKCKKTKPFSEFHKHPTGKNGLNPSCKVCRKAYDKVYNNLNRISRNTRRMFYYRDNRHKEQAQTRRYQALKKGLIPKLLRNCPVEKQRLTQIYKLREVLSQATGIEHHVDHMWPLSDGGPHWSGNLQVITAQENLSKHASICEDTKAVIKASLKQFLKEYECTQS